LRKISPKKVRLFPFWELGRAGPLRITLPRPTSGKTLIFKIGPPFFLFFFFSFSNGVSEFCHFSFSIEHTTEQLPFFFPLLSALLGTKSEIFFSLSPPSCSGADLADIFSPSSPFLVGQIVPIFFLPGCVFVGCIFRSFFYQAMVFQTLTFCSPPAALPAALIPPPRINV